MGYQKDCKDYIQIYNDNIKIPISLNQELLMDILLVYHYASIIYLTHDVIINKPKTAQ